VGYSAAVVEYAFVPGPAAVDISGEYELMSSIYMSLSNNYRLGRVSLGYGLSNSRNIWDLRYYDMYDPPPPTRAPIKKRHDAIGLVFPAYFRFGEKFHFGLIYRPSVVRPGLTNKIKYDIL